MKIIGLFLFVILLTDSCVLQRRKNKDYNSIITTPESTAYQFPELEVPAIFYLDSMLIYDTISDASYQAHFPQSSLPLLKVFNVKIIDAMKTRIQWEQSYIEPCDGKSFLECGYTFDLKPIAFYFDERLISITNVVDTYGAGGNHHNYAWFTFNFDTRSNERIRFQDVFNLPSREDSVAFVVSVRANNHYDFDCLDGWSMPFDSVDFSFDGKGIYVNPELSWFCRNNRSLLSMDSLRRYLKSRWMESK